MARCTWQGNFTFQNYEWDMGSLWVPRDAPIGSVIGSPKLAFHSYNNQKTSFDCYFSHTSVTTASLPNTVPLFAGSLPPIGGEDVNGRVLQTNVPGVGLHLDMGFPFNAFASNTLTPDNGTAIPYSGKMLTNTVFPMQVRHMSGNATFIKTGPIAAGPQVVDGEMFHGIFFNLGKVLDFRMRATINQAQCTVKADAVSADPVQLGTFEQTDFTGLGSTSPAVPFHITLSDCEDDAAGSVAVAHVRLDGVRGSAPLDRDLGLLGLTSNSTATGLGIQMLHADGTPVRLDDETPVRRLVVGLTQLDFQARYYQTATQVTAGLAEGALNFTLTYR